MDDFTEIVGQQRVKAQLKFLLEGYAKTNIVYPVILTGAKGQGKTSIARALGRRLINPETNKYKPFVEINCASLKQASVTSFFEQIVDKYLKPHNYYCTLFFDEASEISKEISMMLLSILDPEDGVSMTYVKGDLVSDFDFRKTTWLFATSEPHLIFHALFDRFEHIDLEDYQENELAQIIARFLSKKEIKFEEEALLQAATVCRGNGRNAVHWAKKIQTRATNNYFSLANWEQLKKDLHIFPRGLKEQEVSVLKILAKDGPCSLTKLTASTGFSAQAVRKTIEIYFLKLGLLEIITPSGRKLTDKGRKYLQELDVYERELAKQSNY